MTVASTISQVIAGLIPGGVLFHPSFKILKVAEGSYNISWSVGPAEGTYNISLVIGGGRFTVSGDAVVIPNDSTFPFNIIGQLVNSALGNVVSNVLNNISTTVPPVAALGKNKKVLSPVSPKAMVGIKAAIEAPVGTEVSVDASVPSDYFLYPDDDTFDDEVPSSDVDTE